jgi:DNA-binding MarR family transcriptional regulator
VSKQAISFVVRELENEGYLSREQDPDDARQYVLRFTKFGECLIADSVQSINELQQMMVDVVGEDRTHELITFTQKVFDGLQSQHNAQFEEAVDLPSLASELQSKLSSDNLRQLIELLAKEKSA